MTGSWLLLSIIYCFLFVWFREFWEFKDFIFCGAGGLEGRAGGRLGDSVIELPDPFRSRRGCAGRLRSVLRRMRNFTCFRDQGKR